MAINAKEFATYMTHDQNILLMGPAGTGKTQSLLESVEIAGLNCKYMSAATLDPYIDLVGLPVAKDLEDGTQELQMLRNNSFYNAEVIFFDEINRAGELKTLNAIFELVQFKSINGERLPNLKCVVAAMNPVGEGYEGTQTLDLALMDRFEVYFETENIADPKYFTKVFGKDMGMILAKWHKNHDHKENGYISPRRMEKIGKAWNMFPARDTLKRYMPPAGEYNVNGLYQELLAINTAPETIDADAELPDRIEAMTADAIIADREVIISSLAGFTPEERVTVVGAVTRALRDKETPESIVNNWSEVYKLMSPSQKVELGNNWSTEVFNDFRALAKKANLLNF